ncbi:transcription-repair coupling factor [Candidatus Saganbacteria bacterium]|nr:transcription-repair coupling factor [Candidatus Saganbacteria bacterium]
MSAEEILRRLSPQISLTNLSGLPPSAKSVTLAALKKQTGKPILVITSSTRSAERLRSEIKFFLGEEVLLLPAAEKENIGERLTVLSRLLSGEAVAVVSPVRGALAKTSGRGETIKLAKHQQVKREALIDKLAEFNYRRLEIVGERGEFSVRGGIMDVYPINLDRPVRMELIGDEIESLRSFDPVSQKSIEPLSSAVIFPGREAALSSLFDLLPKEVLLFIDEPLEVMRLADQLEEEVEIPQALELSSFLKPGQESLFAAVPGFGGDLLAVAAYLKEKREVFLVSKHSARLAELSNYKLIEGDLSSGFESASGTLAVISDRELFGEEAQPENRKPPAPEGVDEEHLAQFAVGDLVVHEDYGIGLYRGLEKLKEDGVESEYILIEYARGDKLYVPLTLMGMVEKYSGGGDFKPQLSRLGSSAWLKTKGRVKKSIKDMTAELLEIYAARQKYLGFPFPPDDLWQKDLEDSFPYKETPDQSKAIAQVKHDMESTRPMDRLVCGDVGYGKTEVAIRAAAKAVATGKQAAVLVPTTILAEQHYHNFKNRFASFPFKVEMLSRFRSKDDQKQVIEALKLGQVDVVIGTHRLLQKDMMFKDLGLLIIDEEQRFGVAHKEKIKKLRKTVDVLTLTATPIPRTLYLSLSGVRDLSVINTPPVDRSPVRTYVLNWNENVVREAILKELDRGGQVFYVFNIVEKIDGLANKLSKLVPEARITVGHGQMPERKLEQTMLDFSNKKYDVLLCSTIIESGLDLPNVNTILIDHADRFGLSQLYQLRGRVGRSNVRAYAYLFYNEEVQLTETAIKRLKALQEFTALGSGYRLAMRDLEIRGAGNLLGAQQSGHLLAVGFDLYCELLEEAARELKGISEPTPRQVEIDIKADAFIPSDYVPDEKQRVALYRRLNLVASEKELLSLKEEIVDRFGRLPAALLRLLEVLEVKVEAQDKGIKSIREREGEIRIEWFSGRIGSLKLKGKNNLTEIRSLIG